MFDIAIIGGGPAGLTAAIYARRAGRGVVLFEKLMPGGQMNLTGEIANYPGFAITEGYTLSSAMAKQAKDLGCEIITAEVVEVDRANSGFTVRTSKGEYSARAVIAAMGASRSKLKISGEDEFAGRGVSYCAVCDGGFFKGREVAVIGGGDAALEDSIYLSAICPKVTLIHRRNAFRGGKLLQEKVAATKNIVPMLGYVPIAISGGGHVERIAVAPVSGEAAHNGTEEILNVAAVFAAVGSVANNAAVAKLLALSENERVAAGENCATSVPGLFVAGDLRAKKLYQIVTAAADGANAAKSAEEYLDG